MTQDQGRDNGASDDREDIDMTDPEFERFIAAAARAYKGRRDEVDAIANELFARMKAGADLEAELDDKGKAEVEAFMSRASRRTPIRPDDAVPLQRAMDMFTDEMGWTPTDVRTGRSYEHESGRSRFKKAKGVSKAIAILFVVLNLTVISAGAYYVARGVEHQEQNPELRITDPLRALLSAGEGRVEVPAAAQPKGVILPDGSTVDLEAGSSLVYRKSFKLTSRFIQATLEGRAVIEVKKLLTAVNLAATGGELILHQGRFAVRAERDTLWVTLLDGVAKIRPIGGVTMPQTRITKESPHWLVARGQPPVAAPAKRD
jgi:hypothetical protein